MRNVKPPTNPKWPPGGPKMADGSGKGSFFNFVSKKFVGPKKFGLNKIWSKKNFDKKCQGLDKLCPKSFVKIGSVTAEIFFIWANSARTNVSLTNVTMTVEIEGPRNYL